MITAIVLTVLVSGTPAAEVKIEPGVSAAAKLPDGVHVDGTPVAQARFSDNDGAHLLLVTVTDVEASLKAQDGKTKWLYGYDFVQKPGTKDWTQVWKTQDFVNDCEFDLTLDYVKDSLRVTDLDGDGVAETRFAYRSSCKSDVSPDTVKVLLHEGATKYAIRGTSREQIGDGQFIEAKSEADPKASEWPKAFIGPARSAWDAAAGAKRGARH